MSSSTPVMVMAFANDPGAYLQMVARESNSISTALRTHQDNYCVDLRPVQSASIQALFELFAAYSDRVVIFHYGGHADGSALQLEADGKAQLAHAGGLAQLLGRQAALQLVFLNGCATQGQVELLLASGVKAVIATAVKIDDVMATEFAEQFYQGLGHRQTIGRAFETARAFVATAYRKSKEVGSFRGMSWAGKQAAPDAALTWGLYTREDGDAALNWKLPDVPRLQVVIRGQASGASSAASLNDNLKATLLKALLEVTPPLSPPFAEDLQRARDRDDFMERDIPPMIINVFPAPIGEQLRILFAGKTIDVPRLRQLVVTYEITIKLFCFAVLAQLWDLRIDKPDLEIADEHKAILNSFMTLTRENAPTFDYYTLILSVVRVFRENNVTPFMPECAELDAELTDEPSTAAHAFMEEMREELRGDVAAEEIASFCEQAQKHLGTLLTDLVFVARYKPTTIKSIEIVKFRNMKPKYKHKQVALDKATSDPQDSSRDYDAITDSGSVILQKDRRDGANFLNLTPFIIDENALLGHDSSKLYFLSHYNPDNESYVYTLVNNPTTELVVPGDDFQSIKDMIDEFKKVVFDK